MKDSDPAPHTPSSPNESPEAIRSRLVAQVGRLIVRVIAPSLLLFTVGFGYLQQWSYGLVLLAALQIIAVAVGVARVAATVRARSLLIFFHGHLSVCCAVLHFGPAMGIGVVGAMSGVWAAVALGPRLPWLMSPIVFLTFFGVGALITTGLVPHPAIQLLDSRYVSTWARVAVTMLAGGLAASWLVIRLMSEYERSAIGAQHALDAERKERALDDKLFRELHHSQRLETLHRLAGGAGHDIMNALAVVLCNADSLRLSKDSFQAELATEILEAANGASKTSRQLAALGQREMDASGITGPAEIVERVGRLLKRVLPASVDLSMEVTTERDLCMNAEALERVLLNLCLNARDAMPSGGSLRVVVAALSEGIRAGGVVITVEDTGVGIDEATCDRVFEPFFTTKSAGSGTGMGLSVVHGLVGAAGGATTVRSTLGTGTAFRVELPPARRNAKASVRLQVRGPSTARLTILLAEDDARLRAVMRRVLEQAGHHVLQAANGAAALTALEHAAEVQLLITDGVLPDTSTQTLIDRFRATHPGATVVVCSGYADDVLAARGIDLSQCGRLPKPFTAAELRAVAEVIE